MTSIYVSTVIPAPVSEIWPLVGDFGRMADWHPVVEVSRLDAGASGDQVGAVRSCTLSDGGELKEKLVSRSDGDHSFSYEFLETPMPMTGAKTAVRLAPVTDEDRTFIEWHMSFEPEPGAEEELTGALRAVLVAGFQSLKARFGAGT